MMKKLKDLTKDEKLILLKAIAAGEVRIDQDTFICLEKTDLYYGMQILAGQERAGVPLNVVFISEARKAWNEIQTRIEADQAASQT